MREIQAGIQGVLLEMLTNTNEWLRFAEAKNGAVVALNSAIGMAAIAIYADATKVGCLVNAIFFSSMIALFLAVAVALLSFAPILKATTLPAKKAITSGNLFFFGNTARMNQETLLNLIAGSLENDPSPSEIEKDIANQVLINSRITTRKFLLFEISMWLTLSALITPPIAIILFWILRK